MNKKMLLVIVIIAIVGVVVFLPALDTANDTTGSIDVVFYDANGNEIPLTYAWMHSGIEVDQFTTTVSWTVTIHGFESDNVVTDGTLTVKYQENRVGATVYDYVTRDIIETRDLIGSAPFDFYLNTILSGADTSKDYKIMLSGALHTVAFDDAGNEITANWNGCTTFVVNYELGSIVLEGSVGW